MFRILKKYINKSDFIKNIATLVTGTAVSQLLPILVSPILTRIYTPENFGTLAVFMSVVMIFGTIANARYEMAVLLPEKDSEALNLVALGVIISTFLSVAMVVFILFFHDLIIIWLENPELKGWIYLIPAVVFLLGLFNMLNYYNTRLKEYKSIAISKVLKSIATVIPQLIFGFLKLGYVGLINGVAIGNFFGNIKLFKNTIKNKQLNKEVNRNNIKVVAKRYVRFPKLTMPATFANKLSTELTNILISTVFNIATLGFYSFAIRMLSVPSSFVGNSVGQVYMQEAANEKNKTGKSVKIFRSVIKKLTIIGIPIFGIIFFVAEDVFAFVFGEEWRISGYYAKILIPLLLVRFVVAPVSVSLSIFEKQHISLFWQLGLLFLSLGSIGLSFLMNLTFIEFLYIYVSVLIFYYLLLLLILRRIVMGKK